MEVALVSHHNVASHHNPEEHEPLPP